MTTFQRLVQRGFEEGSSYGIEKQQIIAIRNMMEYKFSLSKIAKILEMSEDDVRRLAS